MQRAGRRSNLKAKKEAHILDLCLRKTQTEKSHEYRDVDFEKLRFQNVFCIH